MEQSVVERAAKWVGIDLTDEQRQKLETFRSWLQSEAADAGGIGPGEADSVDRRHIADSLCFARGWWPNRPERILDIGSGVGLPAVPIAIVSPSSQVVALDRAGRRIRLLSRIGRILELPNLIPDRRDLDQVVDERYPVIVSRAAIPPSVLRPRVEELLDEGGVAVVGGSHVAQPHQPGFETVKIPAEVLDRPVWILIMAKP